MENHNLNSISFTKVKINDDFWSTRLRNHQNTTLNACLEKCETEERILNFERTYNGNADEGFTGVAFNDSDVYKVIEGVGYSLQNNPNKELEEYVDSIIDKIGMAQQEDGYLDNYFVLGRMDEKWTDMMAHELYCAGHMIEGAIAYKNATGKRKFLDVAIRFADHIVDVFGEGKKNWIVGHQEIELALVKLYRETGEKKYLNLAKWFIEQRGHNNEWTDKVWSREKYGGKKYNQDDKPVRELSKITGHAVRAMYYFCGVADVAAIEDEESYMEALYRLWDNTVNRNMYITGGIGSSRDNEGFTGDYDLPNDTAYCETCAAVGMVYWNHRMNLMTKDSKYVDIVEKELYNGVISGVSLDGTKFFYENPLESHGDHHRKEWYDVSCCPTQIARFIPSVGDYIYAKDEDGVYLNLYISNTLTTEFRGKEIKITQSTNYPWDGRVNIKIEKSVDEEMGLFIRYPSWCKTMNVEINEEKINNYEIQKGYIKLIRKWSENDEIHLNMIMPIELVKSNVKEKQNLGKVAIQRGPLIYCIEEVDNENIDDIKIDSRMRFLSEYKNNLLNGCVVIIGKKDDKKVVAIPYYAWDNRKPGKMKVWIKNEEERLYDLL